MPHRLQSASRILPIVALLVAASLAATSTAAAAEDPVERMRAEVEELGTRYGAVTGSPRAQRLMREGRYATIDAELLALVPDDQKTAADHFLLGNLLFRLDEAASYEQMKLAEALEPDNPLVLLERGIHEHRRGDCERALHYYERFLSTPVGKGDTLVSAYATHCYLRMQRGDEALRVWQDVDFGSHHVSVEKGMYEIFGPARPERRRADLLRRIRKGEHALLGDLFHLDANYEIDWWNVRRLDDLLEYDHELARQLLAPDSPLARELALYDELADLDGDSLRERLEALGLYGEGSGSVPASGRITYALAYRILDDGIAKPEELLAAWEPGLRERARGNGYETEPFLEVLAGLYAATGRSRALREIDELGWHEHHLARFAASAVVGLDPANAAYAQELERAVADFPNDPTLARLYLRHHASGPGWDTALSHFVAAEFSNVSEHEVGRRLNDLMASYAYERSKPAPAKPDPPPAATAP